ncbi:hypothetical protein DFP72DRAFT_1050024 [Ephemerocybe angulata]|uniref:Uncharacterized protein n=1 Tax=Ephemerocybe angulata TaxID=980116 RepID=A0A8H6M0B9_9AGAR|nr:hypothetical protein DFP72DRAFT_1050024 [Tulosesus angulatus]
MNFKLLAAFSTFFLGALAAPQDGTPLTIEILSQTAPQTCGYVVLNISGGRKPYTLTIHESSPPFAQVGETYTGSFDFEPVVWAPLKVATGTSAFFQVDDAAGDVVKTETTVFIEGLFPRICTRSRAAQEGNAGATQTGAAGNSP